MSAPCATRNAAREIRQAATPRDRANLWAARKKAVGTLGRLAPSCVTQDCVIPRSKLPEVLRAIADIGARYDLRIANVFHAGDGNLHPVTLFDERDPDQVRRVMAASHEILELCIGLGGTLTGEHGIGVEKRDYMPLLFPPETLRTMDDVRAVFNPTGLCNPGKVLPTSHGCAYEMRLPAPAPSPCDRLGEGEETHLPASLVPRFAGSSRSGRIRNGGGGGFVLAFFVRLTCVS